MNKIERVTLLVLDSVGCGDAPDANLYGDQGSNTIKNLADAVGGVPDVHLSADDCSGSADVSVPDEEGGGGWIVEHVRVRACDVGGLLQGYECGAGEVGFEAVEEDRGESGASAGNGRAL